MDILAYLLALLAQPGATTPQPAADPVLQTDGGGIPITPGPHQ